MARLRNIKNSNEILNSNKSFIKDSENYKGKWNKEIFHNENPIHIEIGSGKGKFICEIASQNHNINFIAIDRAESILVKLSKKVDLEKLENIKIILLDASKLNMVFDKNEINKIYLNFSDPWPKKRHSKRRLTHINHLNIYKEITSENSLVEFKTDNINLFLFTLETLKENNFAVISKTYDLENDIKLNKDNIKTEYEKKFMEKGFKINKVIFFINKKGKNNEI
ncbi:MAG: tRNA (guanosine(46)-N7)-methyltransferase TrmB [Mycoplasmoidaceae bacterium]